MTMYDFTCIGLFGREYRFTVVMHEENVKGIADYLFKSFNHVMVENAETGEIVYDRYENSDIFVAEVFNYNAIYEVISEIGLDNVYKYEVTVR